jgi:hypothetical protein
MQPCQAVHSGARDRAATRAIPDRACIEQFMLVGPGQGSNLFSALHETWETSNSVRREDGHTLAFFNPYEANHDGGGDRRRADDRR